MSSSDKPRRTWTRACAEVDLRAVRANLARVQQQSPAGALMPVVKAFGYGHGAVPIAAELRKAGVEWLGVALPSEALELRAAGDHGRLLAWLWTPGEPAIADCVSQGIDIGVSSGQALSEVIEAARAVQGIARVHLKIDTGLTRNGITTAEWPDVVEQALAAHDAGVIEVVGVWSHLADGEVPGSDVTRAQEQAFRSALAQAETAGLRVPVRHLGNSGSAWTAPQWDFELMRTGIAIYGLTPGAALGSSEDLGLRPAMTVRAQLAHVKSIEVGTGVSYGHAWRASEATTVGLVPVGYADGIPRSGGGVLEFAVNGRRCPVIGRIAMDQCVIDLGPEATEVAGDEVVLFGPGTAGEPTADEWAAALGTIGYEIVTRIGPRLPRTYVGGLT